jgi:hypothetical protein
MSFGDFFKDIVTLGKHSESKNLARQYEASCRYLQQLQQEHEKLYSEFQQTTGYLTIARENAVEHCNRNWNDISHLLGEVKMALPTIEPYLEPELGKLLKGVSDKSLAEAYKKSQAGAGLNMFLQYQNHRQMQSRIQQYDPLRPFPSKNNDNAYIVGGLAIVMELLNVVFTGISEANELIRQITQKEAEVNKYIAAFKAANVEISATTKIMREDIQALDTKSILMVELKDKLIDLSTRYRLQPNVFRKIRGYFRKQLGLNPLTASQLSQLGAAYNAFFQCTELITIIVTKDYEQRS